MRMSLRNAVLVLLGAAFVLSLVPAGFALDRRLVGDLERRSREDLASAPMILKDRNAQRSETLVMHAQAVAGTSGLAEALAAGERERAVALVMSAPGFPGEAPVLVDAEGRVLVGPAATAGALPPAGEDGATGFVDEETPMAVALARVGGADGTHGWAGVSAMVDEALAGTLAGLTRSDVLILGMDGDVVATTLGPEIATELGAAARSAPDSVIEATSTTGARYWMVAAPLGAVASVAFVRGVEQELAVLPNLRTTALLAAGLALLLALAGGFLMSSYLARPVEGLAQAADRVRGGDFSAPITDSGIKEVERVASAFSEMRRSLAARLSDLEDANTALEDRQQRLTALQSELIQRDRLAANSRLVSELAHEIRNPVANVRNCLEVVRREQADRGASTEFADLAIDELLRMHELAERMLDLNRPAGGNSGRCSAAEVARQIAQLYHAGAEETRWPVEIRENGTADVAMPPDALKQVMLNLVENAREAMPDGGPVTIDIRSRGDAVRIEVADLGAGIDDTVLPNIFDPFFTTKEGVTGVGLGLFVAQGLASRYGGRIGAANRAGGGAAFTVELPVAPEAPAAPAAPADPAGAGGPTPGP